MATKLDTKTLKQPMNITVVRDAAGVQELVDWLLVHPEFGLDLETTPVKWFQARKCRLIQFGDKERQFVVDLLDFVDGDPQALCDAQGDFGIRVYKYPKLHAFMQAVRPFLESGLFLKVGVNLWFEYITLYYGFGFRIWNLFDCMLAERVIHAGAHSLKDFDFFSMEEMMLRYFDTEIDKTYQTSFDVGNVLSFEQIEYAALDVRFPFAIRNKQLAIGKNAGLIRTMQLENDAIGSFADMHAHGEKSDVAKWKANTVAAEQKRQAALDKLDSFFIPRVGLKTVIITDAQVETATAAWKAMNEVTAQELALKANIKAAKKSQQPQVAIDGMEKQLLSMLEIRKEEKERLKKIASDLSKQRTVINKLAAKCQGQALINYDSNAQVYKQLVDFTGLKDLESTNDEDLKLYEGVPVIDALRDYREWDKRVATYGYTWVTEFTTHPCADEGWLSPYDHRLHSMVNQLMAETGRTSSDNPNSQNLPRDKAVRGCFIADDGMLYITIDMSGAELRIIAEVSGAKIWIDAFNRGEDVHSICTEIIFPEQWKADAWTGQPDQCIKNKKTGEMVPYGCEYYKLHTPETLKKFPLGTLGQPMRQKCECPKHKARRDVTKTLNFGIAYGMEPSTLSARAMIPLAEAEHVFARWVEEFAEIWNYLQESGLRAKNENASYDIFGRRRLLPAPTQERARKKCIEDYPEKLEYPEVMQEANISAFIEKNGRKPTKEERFWLTHREPTQKQITRAFIAISRGIERAGKNHRIQGSNASIIKVAMGSGKSPKGRPYLFHTLPLLKAKLVKMVHDELVIMCPIENAQRVAKLAGIAFRTAAAERMTKVTMENEANIGPCWSK